MPTAVQLPAEAHDTEVRLTAGLDPAFAGKGAWVPAAQVPPVWVSSSPWLLPELSQYLPTAVQLPAEAHDTEFRLMAWVDWAFLGRAAWVPVAQVPAVWVSSSP